MILPLSIPIAKISFHLLDLVWKLPFNRALSKTLLCTTSPDYRHVQRDQYSTASEATGCCKSTN